VLTGLVHLLSVTLPAVSIPAPGPGSVADDQLDEPAPELVVRVHRLDPDVALPLYARPGDAGADIVTTVDVELLPGHRATVPTGLAIALPVGYAAFVHPRSGLAARAGLGLVNSPGTIDAGYRGEIKVILINHDPATPISLKRGDRIAQLVIQRVEHAVFVDVDGLDETERGTGGHGSTGGAAALVAQPAHTETIATQEHG
jgi:dUTP pyrophosphatase